MSGNSIGTAAVIARFALVEIIQGIASQQLEDMVASTNDLGFRWDLVAMRWIFNLSTTGLAAGKTYVYRIDLNDGTAITFRFGLR